MKILQRILSKGILITLAIAAGLMYYYRVDLFPQWYPVQAQKEESSTVSASEAAKISPTTAPEESEESIAPAPEITTPSVDEAAPTADAEADAMIAETVGEQPVQEEIVADSQTAKEDTDTSEKMPDPAPASGENPASATAPSEISKDVQDTSVTGADTTSAVPERVADDVTIPVASAAQLLVQARSAYWQKDHARAEEIYQQAAKLDSQNPDVYGELGNLYFSQGKWQQAADAFFAAGTRLAKQGEQERVRHLVTVLRGLDSVQADKLEKSITQ